MKPQTLLEKLKTKDIYLENENTILNYFQEYPEDTKGFLGCIGRLSRSFKKTADQIAIHAWVDNCCDHCGHEDISLSIYLRMNDYSRSDNLMNRIEKFELKDDYLRNLYGCVFVTTDFQDPR